MKTLSPDSNTAEILGIRHAIQWAATKGWHNFTIFSDSKVADLQLMGSTGIVRYKIDM